MTDDLAYLDRHDDGRIPNGAVGRQCRRHSWLTGPNGITWCQRCDRTRDEDRHRQGKRARRLGGDQERRIERVYGPTKIGERGDPVDHIGRVWKWQSKATRADPPLWLAAISEPTHRDTAPAGVVAAHRHMEPVYRDRTPVVIRCYVHAGTRTRDWLFVDCADFCDEFGITAFDAHEGWWVIPGDWWLDHFGRDEEEDA